MINASENNNGRRLNGTHGARHNRVEADFGARRLMSASPRATLERKNVETTSLNALLTNKLLASLPREDFERLLPHFEPVALAAGEDLYQFERGIHFAYFPESAVISQLHVLADGNTTEATMIGSEGLVGLSVLFNAKQPNYWTRVLVAGSALRIRMDMLVQEFGRGGALQRALLAYAGLRLAQLSQRAVCSGLHKVHERLCCWLLMLHDRAGEDQLQLTHDLIASHLGVRRAGITDSAIMLRDRNIISYNRGVVRILDRQGLESIACECYGLLCEQKAYVL